MKLPPLMEPDEVRERLRLIFPEGSQHRTYCTRKMSGSTVFTMLYIAAIEGSEIYLSPKHVYRMTDAQAQERESAPRLAYASNFKAEGRPWYADTSREPIRDETLREGLEVVGAVRQLRGVPTTSSKGRYYLTKEFADLFDPELKGDAFTAAAAAWRAANLSTGALARIALRRHGAIAGNDGVLVTYPNGETRRLASGPSAEITKAVVEQFAHRFLDEPAVLLMSDSSKKLMERDEVLAKAVGFKLQTDRNLPDLILVDTGSPLPLLVFVEVVATDGPINPRRKKALLQLVTDSDFDPKRVAFVTAYEDRGAAPFRKNVADLAWESFAWFVAEPDSIVLLRDGSGVPVRLSTFMRP